MLSCGVVGLLVFIIKDPSDGAAEFSAALVSSLAIGTPEECAAVALGGAVPALIALLKAEKLKAHAVRALTAIAASAAGQAAIDAAGGLSVLNAALVAAGGAAVTAAAAAPAASPTAGPSVRPPARAQ